MELLKSYIVALFILLFSNASSLYGEEKSTTHCGIFYGEPCTVTIDWDDYSGNDEVSGKIQLKNSGQILTFSGDNPRKGFMEIKIAGEPPLKLSKTKKGSVVTWTGESGDNVHHFTRDSSK